MLGPGFKALFFKEVLRFWKVAFQTIVAPVVTTLLYLLIFGHVLQDHVRAFDGKVGYTAYLIPGLAMMAILQNAFANSSSSMIQSKIMRSLIFVLLPPITPLEMFCGYVFGAMVRGMVVGFALWLISLFFVPTLPVEPLWMFAFALAGSAIMGVLGLIAGIWAEKFDQLAAFQNFFIMPLTFLSGVFYSIHSLPAFWQGLSKLNPFFYMIDGFRYGFFGLSDIAPKVSFAFVMIFLALLSGFALWLLKTGYKLRQ